MSMIILDHHSSAMTRSLGSGGAQAQYYPSSNRVTTTSSNASNHNVNSSKPPIGRRLGQFPTGSSQRSATTGDIVAQDPRSLNINRNSYNKGSGDHSKQGYVTRPAGQASSPRQQSRGLPRTNHFEPAGSSRTGASSNQRDRLESTRAGHSTRELPRSRSNYDNVGGRGNNANGYSVHNGGEKAPNPGYMISSSYSNSASESGQLIRGQSTQQKGLSHREAESWRGGQQYKQEGSCGSQHLERSRGSGPLTSFTPSEEDTYGADPSTLPVNRPQMALSSSENLPLTSGGYRGDSGTTFKPPAHSNPPSGSAHTSSGQSRGAQALDQLRGGPSDYILTSQDVAVMINGGPRSKKSGVNNGHPIGMDFQFSNRSGGLPMTSSFRDCEINGATQKLIQNRQNYVTPPATNNNIKKLPGFPVQMPSPYFYSTTEDDNKKTGVPHQNGSFPTDADQNGVGYQAQYSKNSSVGANPSLESQTNGDTRTKSLREEFLYGSRPTKEVDLAGKKTQPPLPREGGRPLADKKNTPHPGPNGSLGLGNGKPPSSEQEYERRNGHSSVVGGNTLSAVRNNGSTDFATSTGERLTSSQARQSYNKAGRRGEGVGAESPPANTQHRSSSYHYQQRSSKNQGQLSTNSPPNSTSPSSSSSSSKTSPSSKSPESEGSQGRLFKPASRGPSQRRFSSGLLRPSKSESNLKNSSQSAMLGDEDQYQIWLMYSGRATTVDVCGCLANLYFADKHPSNGSSVKHSAWGDVPSATGVPVLLLDYGEARSRSSRRLQLILAEKGTGFTLWRDTLDSLSKYSENARTFHSMFLSTNHQRLAGLSFDNAFAAMQFYQKVRNLTADPENVALSGPLSNSNSAILRKSASKGDGLNSIKSSRRKSTGGSVKKLLKKQEISNPCCFNHVTSLKPHDLDEDLQPKRTQSCMQIGLGLMTSSTSSGTPDSQSVSSPAGSV